MKILHDAQTAVQNLLDANNDATGLDKIKANIDASVQKADDLVTTLKNTVKGVTGLNGDEGDEETKPTITGGTGLKDAMIALTNGLSSVTAMATDAKNQQALAEVTASVSDDPTVASNRQALIDAALKGEDTTKIQDEFNNAVKTADTQRQAAVDKADTVLGTKTDWLTFQNDSQAVKDAQKKLDDLVKSDLSTRTQINNANAELITALTKMPENITDDQAVNDNAAALKTALESGDQAKINTALTNLNDAVVKANTALQEAETKAKNDTIPNYLKDQTDRLNSDASSSLAAIVTKTNSMGADSTYTKSQLVDQMSILSSALSGFSAARTEKSTATDSVLSALGTSSLAGDLSNAVSALRSTLSDSAATKTEIENRTAVVNADSLLSSLANPDMKTTSMSSYVSSIASYVSSMASASNVTSSALSAAASALKSVADTPVSSIVEDNTAVKSAESAFASDLIAGKDIASASSALSVAVSTANTELTAAKKSAVSYAIPSNIADQTEGNSALNSELAKVQSMGADSIYTKSALDSEMAVLSDSLSHFTSVLNTARTSAASTAKTTGNDIVNSMASVLKSVAANSDATLSMVASASTALKLATSTVVDSDIADDVAVKNAETDYASALNSGAATSDALASVSLALSVATPAATSVLSSMKSAASVAVVDSNLTDQEDASMGSIVTKLNSLGAKSNGVKVADMSSALSAYNSAVASYKTVLSDAKSVASVTASKTTGNDIVNSMASILTSVAANSAATSSMVASASTALKLATSTVVDSDITDDAAVKSARNSLCFSIEVRCQDTR